MTAITTLPRMGLRALALAAVFTLMGSATAPVLAQGQAPLAEASVEALLDALDSGPRTRSFTRTAPPDESTSECKGKPAGGTKTAGGGAESSGTRNLEAVPYAGDTTAGVNLDIAFANASDKMTAKETALLDNLAKALLNPRLVESKFAVAGHTDSSGKAEINLELSCARALAVRAYLAKKGVAGQRMTAYGFGSKKPMEGTQASAPQNRRVEIRMAP